MKKIINSAPMAVVTTLHTPLTVSLTTKVVNGTLTQAQDVMKNLWLPDRTIEPLFLVPMFRAFDPDKKATASVTPTYIWTVDGMEVTDSTASSDYYIITSEQAAADIPAGTLVVRKNTSYLAPVLCRCMATYQTYEASDEVTLTAENKPDAFYRVDLKTPSVVKYRPMADANSQKTFQAFVQYGKEALVWDDVVGKSVGAVDLGTLTWSKSGTIFTAKLADAAQADGGAALAGYTQDQSLAANKTISTSTGGVRVKDSVYSTIAAFTSAMRGKILFYELATKATDEDFPTAMARLTGFFWYLDDELITPDTHGYVSGQGTETLVLDADYIDGSTVSVQLAVPTFTENADGDRIVTMPTVPNSQAYAQSYLMWQWDDIQVMAIALGGRSVHQYASQKQFNSVAQMNGKDMTATQRQHIRAVWFTHDTDKAHDAKTYYGDGESVTLPASALWRTGKVNVEVGLELYRTGRQYAVTTGGTVTMKRDETKVENKAPLTIISSSNSPLTVSLTLRAVGNEGTLTQAQDLVNNLWLPDRTINPLFLEPVLSAYDPDSKQNVDVTPIYTWYVNDAVIPSSNNAGDSYYIVKSQLTDDAPAVNSLAVCENTAYTQPDVIRCVVTFADTLHLNTITREAEETLTSENKPEAIYRVDISAPQPIVFHPFTDDSTQLSIEAQAQYGETMLTDEVAYFWYLDEQLIDTMHGYVSGQGRRMLTIDLDYIKDAIISVRLGAPTYVDGVLTLPTAPNLNAQDSRRVVWDYGEPNLLPIGRGGSTVRETSGAKVFDAILQVNGKDVSMERREKYARVNWFTHDTDQPYTANVDKGWGDTLTLTKAELYRTGNVNVEVGADLYVLGAYQGVVDDTTGEQIVDDVTGAVVVCNG